MSTVDERGAKSARDRWRRVNLLLAAGIFGSVSAVLPGPTGWAQQPSRPPQPTAAPPAATPPAATPPAAPAPDRLTQAQLEQLLAPIALYPDSLLMQMLMASTYPLEVVQARRWLGQGQNASLRGDALAQALTSQPWDPSVKSLVPFADVLAMMNDQLDWTQQLGDAVLSQQADVMNAVQALRGRAQAAGQLRSGPQQTVTVVQNTAPAPAPASASGGAPAVPPPPQVITIAPAQPDQVAVPVYNPSVVYGSWPYPANPPVYYPPPPAYGVGTALLTGMAFVGTVAVASSLWGWAGAGWGNGSVNVDVDRVNNINANRGQITSGNWQHDVNHRHGTAYRNQEVSNRYRGGGAGGVDRAQSREQFRGRVEQAERGGGLGESRLGAGADRPGAGDRAGGGLGGDRPGAGQRPAGDRPGAGQRPGGDRPGAGQRPGGDRAGAGQRPGGDRPGAGQRPGGDRPGAGQRPGGGQPGGIGHAGNGRPQVQPSQGGGPRGFQGAGQGQGQRERAASARGQASREGMGAARAQAPQRHAGGGGGAMASRGGGGGGGAMASRGGGGGGARGGHGGGGRGGGGRR